MNHVFLHDGKAFSGRILSDTSMEPHMYWFLFDDRELMKQMADDLAFKKVNGRIVPVHALNSHHELLEAVRNEIEVFAFAAHPTS